MAVTHRGKRRQVRHNRRRNHRRRKPINSLNYRESDQSLQARAGGFGEVLDAVSEDGQPASPAEMSRQRHEWAISTEQAMCSAKACGHEPGGIERQLEEARQSEHDWRAILRDFIAATDPSDYRWAPPNRRFVSSGLYLPSVNEAVWGKS